MMYTVVNIDRANDIRFMDGEDRLSNNFQVKEFVSPDSTVVLISQMGIDRLQFLRDYIEQPVIISRAFSTLQHNKKIGGAELSKHLVGIAYDIIKPEGMTIDTFAIIVEEIFGMYCGLGVYESHVHIDINRHARWDKRK